MSEYYESAEAVTITRKRALEELGSHGIFDYDNFFNEWGDKKLYSAQEVLDWLGY